MKKKTIMPKKGDFKETHRPTKKGYIRTRGDGTKHLRMEHCLVWESHYGKIPDGMQIHHKDFNKENNSIENLQLVTPVEHKRLHEGCKLVDDIWYKPCKVCGEYKPCDKENWYFSRGWIIGRICKKCYVQKVCEDRKTRIANGWKRKNYPKKRFK